MRAFFTRPLNVYAVVFFFLIAGAGILLSPLTSNLIILAAVLFILYLVILVVLLILNDKYMKPVGKMSNMVGEMLKGNYQARIHQAADGEVEALGNKINQLARNLSELSIQEQTRSEQLTSVIDNMNSGLILVDGKGYIHLVNRKILEQFGGTAKNYHGYLYYDVLEHEVIHQMVQHTFLYEKSSKEEFTLMDGIDKHYLEIVGVPVFNERNLVKGVVLVLYDITEMKKLELMRKDFVANVSHELKTPITSIKGFAETLMEGDMKDEQAEREFLQIIYKESHRLQLLINDLLVLSRLENENFPLVLTEIHPEELLEEIMPATRQKAEQKQLDLSMDVEESIVFKADRDRIIQVFINLLDNAISYTPAGGEVALHVNAVQDYVHILVRDSGIGIAKEDRPRIFERFYRVDKARSRNTGGTGLGLAIVKHIVEVHEGKISIDSEPDQGTSIHIYLPKESAISGHSQ